MPVVEGFNLTPVKSTALVHPDQIDLRPEGAVGDRRFLFVRENGERLSGVTKAPMMRIRSRYDVAGEHLTIEFPDSTSVSGGSAPDGDARMVKLYDRVVPARPVDPKFTEAVRASTGDETLQLLRVDEPEYAGGIDRVSIVSRASVDDVGTRGGVDQLDSRRFRMLLEIADADAFQEDTWSGDLIRLGDAVVRVGEQMPRCVMTTMNPDTGTKDFPTLDVLASYRKTGTDLMFGMYGDVVEPGIVRVGDPVEPISALSSPPRTT
jgi:MOSC domain-containing protein